MLTAMLQNAVRRDPSKLAIVCGEERISYAGLAERVASAAAELRDLGAGPGDCVAAVLHNAPEFVVAFLATARLRAIFLPLNPSYTKDELSRFVRDADAKIIIADGATIAACTTLAESMGRKPAVVAVGDQKGAIPLTAPSGSLAADGAPSRFSGPALYLYTSGSTDSYKRVCCTQENLHYEALNFVETVGLTPDDTILCTIPLFHSYGIGNCLLDALYLGATLVILEQPSPERLGSETPFINRCGRIAALLRDEKVRFYPGVPYQFSVFASLPANFPIDFSGVRLCVSSGDVLPKRTFDRFRARFGRPLRSLYGSTEAGSIAIDTSMDDRVAFGSLGKPLKNVAIEIRDAGDHILAAAKEGEIWVASPTLPPSGYDNRPKLSAEAFRDGFYRTGDVGMLDHDGRLIITGRKQSFVDIAGYKVDIGEVEEVLHECPGVREAAALGVSIPNMGTLIKAVVVGHDALKEKDVRAFCREKLAFVKVPRLIEMQAALPRSTTGKVLKSELGDVRFYLERIRDPETLRAIAQLKSAGPERRRKFLRALVEAQAAAVLAVPAREIGEDRGFTELGMDSFASIELRARLEFLLERELPETLTFDYPNVGALAAYLGSLGAPDHEPGGGKETVR
jgi:long-chain acyl-CoA synthetase